MIDLRDIFFGHSDITSFSQVQSLDVVPLLIVKRKSSPSTKNRVSYWCKSLDSDFDNNDVTSLVIGEFGTSDNVSAPKVGEVWESLNSIDKQRIKPGSGINLILLKPSSIPKLFFEQPNLEVSF